MSIKMTLRASTQINNFLCTIFSFEFFGWSLKNLRNVEFLVEKRPWVFFNLEFFRHWVFWKRSKKSLAYMNRANDQTWGKIFKGSRGRLMCKTLEGTLQHWRVDIVGLRVSDALVDEGLDFWLEDYFCLAGIRFRVWGWCWDVQETTHEGVGVEVLHTAGHVSII